MAAYFAAQNRNKSSVTLNYTKPEGQELKTLNFLVLDWASTTFRFLPYHRVNPMPWIGLNHLVPGEHFSVFFGCCDTRRLWSACWSPAMSWWKTSRQVRWRSTVLVAWLWLWAKVRPFHFCWCLFLWNAWLEVTSTWRPSFPPWFIVPSLALGKPDLIVHVLDMMPWCRWVCSDCDIQISTECLMSLVWSWMISFPSLPGNGRLHECYGWAWGWTHESGCTSAWPLCWLTWCAQAYFILKKRLHLMQLYMFLKFAALLSKFQGHPTWSFHLRDVPILHLLRVFADVLFRVGQLGDWSLSGLAACIIDRRRTACGSLASVLAKRLIWIWYLQYLFAWVFFPSSVSLAWGHWYVGCQHFHVGQPSQQLLGHQWNSAAPGKSTSQHRAVPGRRAWWTFNESRTFRVYRWWFHDIFPFFHCRSWYQTHFISFCFQTDKNNCIHTQPESTSNCCDQRWCLPQMATSPWPWATILPSSASSL